jgi:glucan phosphoethanolaminetransferase (alkaline phosphatase superfamily)
MENKTGNYWWLIIFGHLVVTLIVILLQLAMLEVNSIFSAGVDYLLVLGSVWLLIWLLTPIALYFDRRYVTRVSSWEPSRDYYAVVIPIIGAIIGGLYLVKRYQNVGIP